MYNTYIVICGYFIMSDIFRKVIPYWRKINLLHDNLGPVESVRGGDGGEGEVHQLPHRLENLAHAAHEHAPLVP